MAEIGPVQFARVAREVAETAVPQYRSPFSKHTFTQPSLLAILCLMRYEDWTYREAEVRLGEHTELREALGLARVPDYTTLYRCLRRTNEDDLTRLLHEIIRRMPPPPDGGTTVAVDGTGLAPGAISTFFVNRVRDRGEGSPGAIGSSGWWSWTCRAGSSWRRLPNAGRPTTGRPCAPCSTAFVTWRRSVASWRTASSTAS